MKRFLLSPIIGVALMATAPMAFAGFDEDVNKAYASYRVALFKSNQNDKAATEKAISKFQQIWTGTVIADYPAAPAKYAQETDWMGTLDRIEAIADKAMAATKEGELAEAHEILEAVRDELDALRDRNGVRVFSNFVNAYHGQMEHVLMTKVSAESWNRELADDLHQKYGALAYLADDLAAHVPAHLKGNDAFEALLKGLMDSVKNLKAALATEDPAAISNAIKALKPAYAKLFVKFG